MARFSYVCLCSVHRNNLTMLDVVLLEGSGGVGQLKFGNRKPGSTTALFFEIGEKHLKDCDGGGGRRGTSAVSGESTSVFTVQRTFTIRNTGDLPIWISGFDVSGSPCQGYGFRVMGCAPFLLDVNDTRKVDLAFTPDFTLSRIVRILRIHTSLTPGVSGGGQIPSDFPPQGEILNYTLVATVPSSLLARCYASLPRPPMEALVYYGLVAMSVFGLCCVLIASFFEADRVLKCTFVSMSSMAPGGSQGAVQRDEKGRVFDLKSIPREVDAEAKANGVTANGKRRTTARNASGGGGAAAGLSAQAKKRAERRAEKAERRRRDTRNRAPVQEEENSTSTEGSVAGEESDQRKKCLMPPPEPPPPPIYSESSSGSSDRSSPEPLKQQQKQHGEHQPTQLAMPERAQKEELKKTNSSPLPTINGNPVDAKRKKKPARAKGEVDEEKNKLQ